ncbi:MAG: CpsD/CapB family tyrosine-protein kinase [Kordiimonadaceae bacterium]|nr:CpsD/CapB family tyrosine-protein kinase [Kordiimonadaceae bacterium]
MERIKQAIEKVKKQNLAAGVTSKSGKQKRSNSASKGLDEFSYVNTKTVELDPAHLEKNRIIVYNQLDVKSTIFDILRTKILSKMQENGWKTIAVTSPTQGCGKTVISVNLAISMARYNDYSIMLADFDLKKPEVSKNLGLITKYSIMDYFDGKVELEDMLVNPGIQRLVVLPNNKAYKDSSALMSSRKMTSFVEEVKDRYASRIIIFDLPPLLATDDAIAFMPNVDCVLLVVGNGMCSKSEIEESMRLLSSKKLLGTVLNKSDDEWRGYT